MEDVAGQISARRRSCNFPRPAREREAGDGCWGRENKCLVTKWRSAMPPRKSALPEGTDHVVRGASAEDEGAGSLASAKDKLVGQVREQVSSLRSQAGSRARSFADDGKARASSLLEDVSEVIDEAAQAVDRKFG